MVLRIDETRNIAYIKLTGQVQSQEILDALDDAVASDRYRMGMGRLWDFTDIDLSLLESEFIPQMAMHSLKFPEGVRDVKVAFAVTTPLEYGLARMFKSYSDLYAKSNVMIFDSIERAEAWMMGEEEA